MKLLNKSFNGSDIRYRGLDFPEFEDLQTV